MGVWLAQQARDAAERLRPVPAPPTAADLLAHAQGLSAGAGLLTVLEQIEVAALSADEAVTYLQQVQRASAWLSGFEAQGRANATATVVDEVQRILAADAVAGRPQYVAPEQVAWSEITAALRLSPVTGEARILEAEELTTTWRAMLDGMLAGDLTIEHARAIGRQLRHLPGYGSADEAEQAAYAKHCATILSKVVPFAATHTPGECGKKTSVLVTAIEPAGARTRRREAAERNHGVFLNPLEPGTSEIRAVMPTAHAEAVMQAVNNLAKDARFETAEGCITRGQRQVAALVALTLGDPGSVAVVTGPVQEAKLSVHVNVLVPLDTIVGVSEQGWRIGSTPATADEITDLIAQASLESSTIRRLVTDSTGCILDAGGRTDQCNLGPLCKHHHEMKTAGYWHITASHRNGSCTWRSPLGRVYHPEPPDEHPPF